MLIGKERRCVCVRIKEYIQERMGGEVAQERLWFLKAREDGLGLGVYGFVYVQKQPLKEGTRVVYEKAARNPAVWTTVKAAKPLKPHCEVPLPFFVARETHCTS